MAATGYTIKANPPDTNSTTNSVTTKKQTSPSKNKPSAQASSINNPNTDKDSAANEKLKPKTDETNADTPVAESSKSDGDYKNLEEPEVQPVKDNKYGAKSQHNGKSSDNSYPTASYSLGSYRRKSTTKNKIETDPKGESIRNPPKGIAVQIQSLLTQKLDSSNPKKNKTEKENHSGFQAKQANPPQISSIGDLYSSSNDEIANHKYREQQHKDNKAINSSNFNSGQDGESVSSSLDGSLSVGVVAGIFVGCVIALLVIGLFIYNGIQKRKNRKSSMSSNPDKTSCIFTTNGQGIEEGTIESSSAVATVGIDDDEIRSVLNFRESVSISQPPAVAQTFESTKNQQKYYPFEKVDTFKTEENVSIHRKTMASSIYTQKAATIGSKTMSIEPKYFEEEDEDESMEEFFMILGEKTESYIE